LEEVSAEEKILEEDQGETQEIGDREEIREEEVHMEVEDQAEKEAIEKVPVEIQEVMVGIDQEAEVHMEEGQVLEEAHIIKDLIQEIRAEVHMEIKDPVLEEVMGKAQVEIREVTAEINQELLGEVMEEIGLKEVEIHMGENQVHIEILIEDQVQIGIRIEEGQVLEDLQIGEETILEMVEEIVEDREGRFS